jgi:hypothetical protein
MFKAPSVLVGVMLLSAVPVLAADTPDPNSTGEATLPSGSNAAANPAGEPVTENKPNLPAPATSPGEENKGKPPIKTE